jgi:hypothetical protein
LRALIAVKLSWSQILITHSAHVIWPRASSQEITPLVGIPIKCWFELHSSEAFSPVHTFTKSNQVPHFNHYFYPLRFLTENRVSFSRVLHNCTISASNFE